MLYLLDVDVASDAKVCAATVARDVRRGILRCEVIAGRRIFDPQVVAEYVEKRKQGRLFLTNSSAY